MRIEYSKKPVVELAQTPLANPFVRGYVMFSSNKSHGKTH